MTVQDTFTALYTEHIHRAGSDALLDYLVNKSDFLTAPASARYHNAYEGGLAVHSMNVYRCLADYLARPRVTELYGLDYTPESIAIAGLLHDVCKIGCYRPGTRNVKGPDGKWRSVPTFEYNDTLPYGHGEKSVYIITGFMRLSREEAFAIRWHMGFSGPEDSRTVGQALRQYPLAFALATADMEASFFLERDGSQPPKEAGAEEDGD
ncbi:MAG: hydrolase [Oscillospiraceae bacterium]|nr:hydrolase [Oscillospiraceae bacterium]